MGYEALKRAGIEKPEHLPLLVVTQTPEELANKIDFYREETKRFFFHFNKFKENYPEFFAKLYEKHPGLETLMDKIDKLGTVASNEMNSKEMAHILTTYSFYAEQINHVISQTNREASEAQERSFVNAVNMNVDHLSVELIPEEEAEIKNFTQELWDEMFPESNVDRFMGWVTGQKISEQGKLRWFFAPANGIEMAVMGFIDLFKIETYVDLVDTIQYMYGMSYEDWCDALQMLKIAYNNLSTEDGVNASISILYSLVFLGGGFSKIVKKLEKLKCAKKIKTILQTLSAAHSAEERLKPLPGAVMGGMILKYD